MGEQEDVATVGAALGEFDVVTSGLRGHLWRALARPGVAGAAEAARAASADAADLARVRLDRGDPDGALNALEAARGLALFAATEVRPVADHLAAAGKPDLARQWQAAAGVADPHHLPADLRRDVLATLLSRSTAAALLTPPSVAEIQAALAAVDADVLVHLIPGHAVLTPASGPVTHLPLPALTADAEHLDRFLATLALHNAAASTTSPLPEAGPTTERPDATNPAAHPVATQPESDLAATLAPPSATVWTTSPVPKPGPDSEPTPERPEAVQANPEADRRRPVAAQPEADLAATLASPSATVWTTSPLPKPGPDSEPTPERPEAVQANPEADRHPAAAQAEADADPTLALPNLGAWATGALPDAGPTAERSATADPAAGRRYPAAGAQPEADADPGSPVVADLRSACTDRFLDDLGSRSGGDGRSADGADSASGGDGRRLGDLGTRSRDEGGRSVDGAGLAPDGTGRNVDGAGRLDDTGSGVGAWDEWSRGDDGWPADRRRPEIVRPWFLTDHQGPDSTRPWPVASHPRWEKTAGPPAAAAPAEGPAVMAQDPAVVAHGPAAVAQDPAVVAQDPAVLPQGPAGPAQGPAGQAEGAAGPAEGAAGPAEGAAGPAVTGDLPCVDLTSSLQDLGRWSWDAVVGPLVEYLTASRVLGRPDVGGWPEVRRFPGVVPMPIAALGAPDGNPRADLGDRPPRIVLVAAGDLARVPWAAARRGDGTYALELLAISQAASARLLCHNAALPSLPPSAAGLVVADPDTGGGARDLPAVRLEAYAIQQSLYPQARITGRRPDGTASPSGAGTLDQVRAWLTTSNPSAGGTLHLACTGGGERPGAYALMAGGERLTATEVVARTGRARRPIDLVVLAGGRTGLSLAGDDEAFGLGTAFLAGDVRSVLATRWTVPDAVAPAVLFMTHLFRRQGRTVWAALRAAQLWMLDRHRTMPPEMPPELAAAVAGADPSAAIAWAAVTHWGR